MKRTIAEKIEIIFAEMKKNLDNSSKAGIHLVFYTSLTNRIMFRKNSLGQWRLPDAKAIISDFENIKPETIIDSLENGLVKDMGWKLEQLPKSTNVVIDSSEPVAVIILTDLKNYINTAARFAELSRANRIKFCSERKIAEMEKKPEKFVRRAFFAIKAKTILPWSFY